MPNLSPEQKERAVNLQKRQWTHARIAFELGVHRVTISRFLSRHNERVVQKLLTRCAAVKGRQIAQLEHAAAEAWEAWEKSKAPAETVKTTDYGPVPSDDDDAPAPMRKVETTVKQQAGDPAYIREMRGAFQDVREILGIGRESDSDDIPLRDALSEAESRVETYQPARAPSPDEGGPTAGDPGPVP